jgi:hypothetical protein
MVRKHLLIAAASLLALPGVVSAIGIGVIGGDPPGLVSTDLGEVQATGSFCDGDGNCTYVFNNDTGGIITSLSFSTVIATGLTQTEIDNAFTCTQVGQFPVGYFLTCNPSDYNPSTGELTYEFEGVLPPGAGETCPDGNCDPDQRGIPPDTDPMDKEFQITLSGWVSTATVDDSMGSPTPLFGPNGVQSFTNDFTSTATPEPSTLAFLAIALLLSVGVAQLRRRKLTASRRSA